MNLLKLKFQDKIQAIIKSIILQKIPENQMEHIISQQIESLRLPQAETKKLFEAIEVEIMSLHEGNIILYQIQPN